MALNARSRGGLVLAAALLAVGLVLAVPAPAPAQQKQPPLPPGLPLPDLDNLFPPGTIDPEQLKMLKKLLEGQGDMQKMMEDLQKQLQQQLQQAFPGGLPNLPNGAMPLMGRNVENRLGAVLQQPSQTLVEQLDLPA